jgi:hypothetical protein
MQPKVHFFTFGAPTERRAAHNRHLVYFHGWGSTAAAALVPAIRSSYATMLGLLALGVYTR